MTLYNRQKKHLRIALVMAVMILSPLGELKAVGPGAPGQLLDAITGATGTKTDCCDKIINAVNNEGSRDLTGQKIGAANARNAAQYDAIQRHKTNGLIQQSEIVRSHPELSSLACAIATANISVPAIKDASQRVVGEITTMITNMLAQHFHSGNGIDKDRQQRFECAMGMVADLSCDTQWKKIIVGAYKNRHIAITQKDSIACDIDSVRTDIEKILDDTKHTPQEKNLECIAAISALTHEFQNTRRYPTEKEMDGGGGTTLRGRMDDVYARAWENMGNILAAFEQRVSVPKSAVNGDCWKGLDGKSEKGIKQLLEDRYGDIRRTTYAPFGMPQDGFCLSQRQIEKGKEMMGNFYMANLIGGVSTEQMLQDTLAMGIDNWQEQLRSRASIMNATTSAPPIEEFPNFDPARAVSDKARQPDPR